MIMKSLKYTFVFLSIFIFFSSNPDTVSAISIPEEKEVAKKFMKMVKQKNMLLEDPIANYMVTQVGNHLLSFLPPQPFDYSFYIVDEDIFNAFASPGANIFFYRGLITSLNSIDDFAGIVAHEIAHAESRHVSESIDRAKYASIGSLAGILAGVIIGTKSDGDTGAAVMQGSMALGHTAMLAFTRENETEADEKGIMFLKKSCYAPEGLINGLMVIRDSDFRGIESIPDYVKTHPGTGNRIAHAENILEGYIASKEKMVCKKDLRFDMVKYRLLGLYAKVDPTYERLTTELRDQPSNAAIHYGLGLIYARKFMRDKAVMHLKKALSLQIFDPMILLELGRIYLDDGDPQKSLNVLKGIESEPVLGLMASFYQGTAHLELRNLSKAKELFTNLIDNAPALFPKAYYNMANIMSLENRPGLSHYYLGLYYTEINNHKNAVLHLNKALESLSDEKLIKKAKALLEELTQKSARDRNRKS